MPKRPNKSSKRAQLPIKAEASAKLKAEVSANYSVRKSISENVPDDVVRAKAGAWLSLISPLTEWAGLKGDQLAYKREILRLHREETLTEIAMRFRTRLNPKTQTGPIPAKFVVPFLESASLEENNSPLIDLWANLLVSAAENYNPHYVHFSNIIKQISFQQAEIFKRLIGSEDRREVELSLDNLLTTYSPNFLEEHVLFLYRAVENSISVENFPGWFEGALNNVGIEIVHYEIEHPDMEDFIGDCPTYSNYDNDQDTDFAILSALGLVRYVDTNRFKVGNATVKVMCYYLTTLGFDFASACGVIR